MTEDERVGWYHRLNGHEFDQALGDGEGQGSLVCCNPLHCKESDTTGQLNNNHRILSFRIYCAANMCSIASWVAQSV